MHVTISAVTGLVISTRLTKEGYRIRKNNPKSGYWKVVWVRKRDGVKDVSGILTKRKAEDLAGILNALTGRQVILVVETLHSKGQEVLWRHELDKRQYTGRSFSHG